MPPPDMFTILPVIADSGATEDEEYATEMVVTTPRSRIGSQNTPRSSSSIRSAAAVYGYGDNFDDSFDAPYIRRSLSRTFSSDGLEAILSASPSVRSLSSMAAAETPRRAFGVSVGADDKFFEAQRQATLNVIFAEAWERLRKSIVMFKDEPVGTIAALDPSEETLNYNQVFVRDFIPSALAFLINNEPGIVKNFLLKAIRLQSNWEKRIDNFTLGKGAMPASFKVQEVAAAAAAADSKGGRQEKITADFGESAIGRVAPVDSGFWWIILLRAYGKATGDLSLWERPDCQRGIELILNLCLSEGFDTFPTLLCADGCCMVDRRMGIYGYPIEIQALFYMALRCARLMLKEEGGSSRKDLIERIDKRLKALSYHIRSYYWLDFEQLNKVYRYKTEEYSETAVNKFNVIPDSIPDWVFDFMPMNGGYFIGNVSPARMDFRWFALGNCVAILSSLATPEQQRGIMDLFEERWAELIGEMPLKIAFPAFENHEWRIVTGCDPKNTRWSYHNAGSWPVLIWLLTAACIKAGRPHIAEKAIRLLEERLSKDSWPEYYDGRTGRYVGKQARKYQTWSIAGYLVAKMMLEDPTTVRLITLDDVDKKGRHHHNIPKSLSTPSLKA